MKIQFHYLPMIVLLMAGCSKSENASSQSAGADHWEEPRAVPVVHGNTTFDLGATEDFVNVMGDLMPPMPQFPSLKISKGVVKGYVADLTGRPLKGAVIGVRSTTDGGFYSGAQAETNDQGFYEIKVPAGAAHFYAAGYTVDYGGGRAVMALHAADGNTASFPSANGTLKNFVLMAYGVANKDLATQRPRDETNYFGGALNVGYTVDDPDDIYTTPGQLPAGAEIVVTLTPDGESLYGDNRSFTINKKVDAPTFTVTNIPVGRYVISARMKDGRPLKIREMGPYATAYPFFGLQPKEATGDAKVLFTPLLNSQPSTVLPEMGNWRSVQLKLELP